MLRIKKWNDLERRAPMKTKEELSAIKEEVEALTEEELRKVTGGVVENDGDKAIIPTTKADIENAVDKINYEAQLR